MVWLQQQNSQQAAVFLNDIRLGYYYADVPLLQQLIHARGHQQLPTLSQLQDYEFIALYNTKEDQRIEQLVKSEAHQFQEIKIFFNEKHDKYVSIFKNIANWLLIGFNKGFLYFSLKRLV